ncbi:hypothetical protein CJ030_MR6G011320 [Morella rubra]|uniref:Uncharacterized protein n=1 Tax=Morella rubra TaxID=262757 RepID=A0A6A1V7U1_9ROSI|nr:hypothetical protein CJ030_MR6G011320 [Morella rubra]
MALQLAFPCECDARKLLTMPEMGFQEQTLASRGGGVSALDSSLDSVIFTLESNFCSLFSSTSASVDRCSFASDAHDRDSLASEISLHDDHRERLRGPDLNKPTAHITTTTTNKHSRFLRKGENVKECQDRRSRTEALSRKPDRQRPASLDLNNVAATFSSPRLGTKKESSALSSRRSSF